MLILSRRKDERLVIGYGDITITVVEIRGDRVRLSINGPKGVPVHRQEVFDAIQGRSCSCSPESSPDEPAFLQAILDAPEDDGIRLIYADWLEERGDPRGEFIRLQCYLSQLPTNAKGRTELVARETTLLAEYGFTWRQALPPFLRYQPFVRGFVETASMTTGEFLAADVLDGPDSTPARPVFLALPTLRRVCSLTIFGSLADPRSGRL